MAQIKEFSYNPNTQYQPSRRYKTKDLDINKQTIELKQASDGQSGFKVKISDTFEKYVLPYVESDAIIQDWRKRPMQFWQNQINFALWYSKTGCIVSLQDHMSGDIPAFARSLIFVSCVLSNATDIDIDG